MRKCEPKPAKTARKPCPSPSTPTSTHPSTATAISNPTAEPAIASAAKPGTTPIQAITKITLTNTVEKSQNQTMRKPQPRIESKACRKCQRTLPIEDFPVSNQGSFHTCIPCKLGLTKKYISDQKKQKRQAAKMITVEASEY